MIYIQQLYQFASLDKQWVFLVAGSANVKSLNGYSHEEMCTMYVNAGNIPDNVLFSESYTKIIERSYAKKNLINRETETWAYLTKGEGVTWG
jgi:dimeric dUTPase (all-alpha-NTP-PPase superfamily)